MLILVQHGEAAPEDVDPERPLTERGREAVKRVATHLAERGVRPAAIWHSGKLRARQTAELMGAALEVGELRSASGMAPLDDPAPLAQSLSDAGDVMLVGHLPHLSRLVSLLLVRAPEPEVVRFQTGGAVALDSDEGAWRVVWFVTPDLV